MTFAELITELRIELDDATATRWSDSKLLSLLKRACRRTYNIAANAQIKALRQEATITTAEETSLYDLPDDCGTPCALYGSAGEIERLTDNQWHRAINSSAVQYWRRNGSQIEIKAAPSAAGSLTLVYYPVFDDSLTSSSTVPVDQLRDLYLDYAALRAKNVDEMAIDADLAFMREWETNVLFRLQADEPMVLGFEGRQL